MASRSASSSVLGSSSMLVGMTDASASNPRDSRNCSTSGQSPGMPPWAPQRRLSQKGSSGKQKSTPWLVRAGQTVVHQPSIQAVGGGKGGGVLDRPVIVEKPTPGRESEFDLGTVKKKKLSPPYRVMLHNDNFNKREYVVQVLMKCIPEMTVDIAVNIMQEAHVNGVACAITCGQEEAEEYCNALRNNGLVSSIEPADKC
ncbi:Clp protease adaptor containing protein [Klebsormidium nitens]|uniref:Clp protease adaptor containing protein n=1 Tax=Klebsormidium nitens TaxID=105231 RepID=A0A1Y1HWP9_KLENI|nr:Clp protease adaptor containing protein [Klebsormidium nitens]|eukprot:GAQ82212.1 Clp protease adaptor containing protein [Klebsormidium nitens]